MHQGGYSGPSIQTKTPKGTERRCLTFYFAFLPPFGSGPVSSCITAVYMPQCSSIPFQPLSTGHSSGIWLLNPKPSIFHFCTSALPESYIFLSLHFWRLTHLLFFLLFSPLLCYSTRRPVSAMIHRSCPYRSRLTSGHMPPALFFFFSLFFERAVSHSVRGACLPGRPHCFFLSDGLRIACLMISNLNWRSHSTNSNGCHKMTMK